MEFELEKPAVSQSKPLEWTPEDSLRAQAHRELAKMAVERKEARATAAQIAPEVIEPTAEAVVEVVPEPETESEVLAEKSSDVVPVVEESTDDAVQEVRSDVGELLESEDVPELQSYVFQGLQNEEFLGEGLESRVTRGVDVFTEKKVLKYEAKPGMGDYLLNHASHLQKLSYKSGFLKLMHLSSEGETPFMICEDPGTIPIEEVLPKLNLSQRIDLVKQLADRLKTLHAELGVLHRDLRPDQLYVCQKEDGSFELYLSDFGVAAKMGEENELECSLEDPTHARAVSHFKAVFASADVAEGLPFDVQAEIEVFSKVGAYLLTRLVPSRGVEVGLRKIKPDAKDAAEVEKVKHCLSTAAAEREDRYQNMSEFCYDMNARHPMTSEQLKALHGIYDAFKNDLEIVIQQVKQLEEGEVQLAAEPLKTLRALLPGFAADMPPETKQEQAPLLEKLDAALAKAIATFEKNEAGIIEELERIGKERDREFREEESVTAGDEIILTFLEHPSDRVRAAAAMASCLTHGYESLRNCKEGVLKKAREVIHASAKTENPDAWRAMWVQYREWKFYRDEHLDRDDSILYVRMLKEGVSGKMAGVVNSLGMSGRVLEEDYDSLYESMENAYKACCENESGEIGKYEDQFNWMNHFELFLKLSSRSKKAQAFLVRWLRRLDEPVLGKDGNPCSLTKSGQKLKEAAKHTFFESLRTFKWDDENLDDFVGYYVKNGKLSTLESTFCRNDMNYNIAYGVNQPAVGSVLRPVIERCLIIRLAECVEIIEGHPEGSPTKLSSLEDYMVGKAFIDIDQNTRHIKLIPKELAKRIIQLYMSDNKFADVNTVICKMEFDGEFLTKLLNDVFEAAKKDKEIQNKYKLFPFKKRGTKYCIADTKYDQLLTKIYERICQDEFKRRDEFRRRTGREFNQVTLDQLELDPDIELTQIFPGHLLNFFRSLQSIYDQLLVPDTGTFSQKACSFLGSKT